VGVTLAAIADDGDLLGLDEIEIGVPIVINAHVPPLSFSGGVEWLKVAPVLAKVTARTQGAIPASLRTGSR
jgi:hypothetical protein